MIEALLVEAAMYESDARKWAETVFGNCELGDVRRGDRAIDYAARLAGNPQASTDAACGGDKAAAEGAHRFLRNKAIAPTDIDEGVFENTAYICASRECVLEIQDTTTVAVASTKVAQRADWGSGDGFQIHSCLMVDAVTSEPIGLIEQQRWMRDSKRAGKGARGKRPYEEKESYKWELAHRRVMSRTTTQDNIITVSDREADIFNYLAFLLAETQRFVQRASSNRPVKGRREKTFGAPLRGRPNWGRTTSKSSNAAPWQQAICAIAVPGDANAWLK